MLVVSSFFNKQPGGNMKLSHKFELLTQEDCFDPILIADTELFVDPFAVFDEREGFFANSFSKILAFFNEGFKLAANTPMRCGVPYKKLELMMTFPEVNEIGLGYSDSNNGAGASRGFRDQIIDSIYKSISRGMISYRHFEEIGIFEKGIGCDRISDITCNILKEEIIAYTQDICKKLNIPMIPVKMKHIRFDFHHLRWVDGVVELPYNKHKNRGILLVPRRFLNDLPTINSDAFRDYLWDFKSEILRTDLNYSIKANMDKTAIMDIATRRPEWVKEYEEYQELQGYKSYDLKKDKKGVYAWADKELIEYVQAHPISFLDEEGFYRCIFKMCESFKNYIETEKGYSLLWNDDSAKPKPEAALQTLFYGFVKAYGMFLDIDITRESNAGSGPVDFKCSQGYHKRVLIETKLVSNTRYWHGLERQLPQYLRSEEIEKGIFVLVSFSSEEHNKGNDYLSKVRNLELPYEISTMLIDASRNKQSASKL